MVAKAPRLALLLPLLALSAAARADEPTLRSVTVRGLQIGATTTLTIDGDGLGKTPRLLLPFAVKQSLKPGGTDRQATFDVTLPTDVVPGTYQLRVVTDGGVSVPAVLGVDDLPQRPLTPALQTLPAALHGSLTGAGIVTVKFSGKAGQKLLVEVEAQRLGSKLRPVVHLYTAKRRQLAWAWPTPSLFGDTRLEALLPEDGIYSVNLHDEEYAGPAPGHYRLKLGLWAHVDAVFPPVVGKGKGGAVVLLGVPAGRAELPPTVTEGVLPLPWPKGSGWSGPRPFVRVSPFAECLRREPADKVQDLPAGPVGVSGRLAEPNAEHRYRVPVTPGSKVKLEVFAERYGSPIDVALAVCNDAGADLARTEDAPGTLDAALEYTVPAKTTTLLVAVRDAQGRGGARGVYRLVVEPKDQAALPGTFRLLTPTPRLALPIGGRAVVPIWVERVGYAGLIELTAENLPAGLRLEGNQIPAGVGGALVTLHRGDAPAAASVTRWRGRAADGTQHGVALQGHPLARLQPWLAEEIALAPTTAKAADFQIDWRGVPPDARLIPGHKLALPVKVTGGADKSFVRLTLLTSQLPPRVNNQPDVNKTLRLERAIELQPKKTDGDPTLLVPAELPADTYDVTVQAELLTPDKQRALAVAFAPVRRLPVRVPLAVMLDGPTMIQAVVDPKKGATLKLTGKVERREGLAGDVTLSLTGLPPGARADAPAVKAGTNVFTLTVVLPPNTPAGELRGLKLTGSAATEPKQPNVRVRSRDIELTLVVKAAAK